MSGKDLYAPKMYPTHPATARNQRNGNIINNPVFAEMGGLSSPSQIERSMISMTSPGNVKSPCR